MGIRAIGVKEVEHYLSRPGMRLVDLRSREDYARSHLEGAINVPYEEGFQPERQFAPGVPYILYCERGGVSLTAARRMGAAGYEAYTVIGGIRAFEELYGEPAD